MQDFKLTNFKPTDFKDNFGNVWCEATFEGVGEPVKWVVKDITTPVIGQSYYGEMKDMKSKTGKTYVRFYKRERPDGEVPARDSGNFETVDKQDAISRSVALNNAVNLVAPTYNAEVTTGDILRYADEFLVWLKSKDEYER